MQVWICACLRAFIHQFLVASVSPGIKHCVIYGLLLPIPGGPSHLVKRKPGPKNQRNTKCPLLNRDLQFRKICYVRSHTVGCLKGQSPWKLRFYHHLRTFVSFQRLTVFRWAQNENFWRISRSVYFLFSQFKETSEWSIHESMKMFFFPVTFYSLK